MLQFFRKYQKFFFIIVTFVIVISFSFFGTFSTFTQRNEVTDREIGKLIDGSVLMEQKLFGLLRLLQHGIEEGGRTSNLLNDSLLHKDLILSGLGEILAKHYYEQMSSELSEKWKRVKHFVPYVHPHAPHISAKGVWSQMAPKINALLDEVKNAPAEFSPEQLPLLFKLYAAQADFPPHLLLQMLYFQQSQNGQIRPDPGLPSVNVALFGFESIEDWFGSKFIEEAGKFILNAAIIAREEGYVVKKEEAQVDLLRNAYKGLKLFGQGENPTNQQAHHAFQSQLRYLGLSEGEAIEYWRQSLFFRRLFHEVGESVFLDRLALQQFMGFAKPAHSICRYRLPNTLQFENFWQMLKFQRYLEVAFEGDYLSLPEKKRDPQVVRDEHPELVYKTFEVELATVKKGEIASQVGLKQTWDWEAEEENFAKLQQKFPILAEKKCRSVAERLEVLDGLNELIRLKVDTFARNDLVTSHPEWIVEALAKASREKKTLKVRLKGGDPLFSGEKFLAQLESESKELEKFTSDGETFYSVHVLEKGKGWHLLSFEEACRDSTLDHVLESLLQTAYAGMDFKQPYEEIKEEVGAKVYADLLRTIGEYKDWASYAKHRLDGYLQSMRKLAIHSKEEFEKKQNSSLWALEKREEQMGAAEVAMAEGDYSPIAEGSFFQLLEKKLAQPSDEEMSLAKQHLKRDAEQKLMQSVLQRF